MGIVLSKKTWRATLPPNIAWRERQHTPLGTNSVGLTTVKSIAIQSCDVVAAAK